MSLLPFGSPPGQKQLGTATNPFPATGAYFYDTGGTTEWILTIDTTGHLVTTQVVVATPTTGNPIGPGPFLWLTYS